jgi:hypothetical protein
MAGFEISSGLRVPFSAGLMAGRAAIGLTSRMLEPAANRLMLPAGGQTEFVQNLEDEQILEEVEAAADLVRDNLDSGVSSVLEYGYLHVGQGVLKADRAEKRHLVPRRTVLDAAGVAVDIHLMPKRLPLTQEGVARLDYWMDTRRKVFSLPSTR